ncbi:MAG: tRNA lysidine(34) synthetase TilS [Magnetococcales bacterium]|nr:tRNA lysidine(34) synthetase TilS [Magnetococcales bacterium]
MKRSTLPHRLLREAGHLFAGQPRVVAAVSGGGDSVALAGLLLQSGLVAPENLILAHFDHNLRPDSGSDRQFTEQLATAWGLPCITATWNDRPVGGNLHAQARAARYGFLIATARKTGATVVATGHQMDDRAETFLDRLLRGSGTTGLAAMPPTRPLAPGITLVRPLLAFRHQELQAWLMGEKIPWREDPGNANLCFLRSRIRHQLLPELQKSMNHDPAERIANAAARLTMASDALEWCLDRLLPGLEFQAEPDCFSSSRKATGELPDELARRLLARCHRQLTGSPHPPGQRATEQFLRLLHSGRRSWSMAMHGLEIRTQEERLMFFARRGPPRRGVDCRSQKRSPGNS